SKFAAPLSSLTARHRPSPPVCLADLRRVVVALPSCRPHGHLERKKRFTRAAGYTREDDEELEDGSSVEEEPEGDDVGEEDTYEEAMEELPSYSRPEVVTNGYAKHVPRANMSGGMQPDPDTSAVSHMNRQRSRAKDEI
ncbi:hypothetical protein C0992_002445, partial [Termitomyces sp. T32_za158]